MTFTAAGAIDWCTCPAWRNQKPNKPRDCPHARLVRAEGQTGQTSPEPVKASQEASSAADEPVRGLPPAPMLASAMTTRVEGAEFDATFAHGWTMEQKMDGHRITVVIEGADVWAYARPRGDKPPTSVQMPGMMIEALQALGTGVYDGEFVTPGGISSDVSRVLAAIRNGQSDGSDLMFIAWDVVSLDGASVACSYSTRRREMLLDRLRRLPAGQRSVSTVESVTPTWAAIEEIWRQGGEGAILKRSAATYQAGRRSPDWLKVKEEGAAVGRITGFKPGSFGPHSVTCLTLESGIETTVKTKNKATLADIAKDETRYIGARLVISHKGLLKGGKPRHPVFDHLAGEGE